MLTHPEKSTSYLDVRARKISEMRQKSRLAGVMLGFTAIGLLVGATKDTNDEISHNRQALKI
jgi:anthranilate/para-aminobenzoate synthase component II